MYGTPLQYVVLERMPQYASTVLVVQYFYTCTVSIHSTSLHVQYLSTCTGTSAYRCVLVLVYWYGSTTVAALY